MSFDFFSRSFDSTTELDHGVALDKCFCRGTARRQLNLFALRKPMRHVNERELKHKEYSATVQPIRWSIPLKMTWKAILMLMFLKGCYDGN